MRLFLSSYQFGNYSDELLKLVGENKKVAYIGNAKDDCQPQERKEKIAESKSEFEKLGFEFTEIDLRNYFVDKSGSKDVLIGKGLVWLGGGNTFLLRRALKDSGLDKIIVSMVKSDMIAYGGSSAGSIIPTPSLHGTEHGDDPSVVERIYGKKVVWDGLGLIQEYIVPHYDGEWFVDESKAMKKYFEDRKLTHQALQDGQVLLVNNSDSKVLA